MGRRLILLIYISACHWHIGTLSAQELTLLFAGDAMLHKNQIEQAFHEGKYDFSSYFEYIEPEASSADLAVVNLEVTLGGKPYKGYPMFSAPDEFAVALKNAGFNVFLTANNHALDKYSKGINRTIDVLDSLKVYRTGTFKNEEEREHVYPLIIEKKGIRIAFLNYTYGTNGLKPVFPCIVNYIDNDQIKKDIQKAREQRADIIIANMHWGLEYKLLPNKTQKQTADFLMKNGVDIVMGSHPHVVQPSEIIRDENGNIRRLIVYSLGNLISDMKATNTDGGQLMKLTLSRNEADGVVRINSCGYILHYTYKERNDKSVVYRVLPISLVEEYIIPLFRKQIHFPDQVSYMKLLKFTNNARKLFAEYNVGIFEYRTFFPDRKENEFIKKLPVLFGK